MSVFKLVLRNATNSDFIFDTVVNETPNSQWIPTKASFTKNSSIEFFIYLPLNTTLQGVIKFKGDESFSFVVLNKVQREAGASIFTVGLNDKFISEIIIDNRNRVEPNLLAFIYVESKIAEK